MMALRYLVLIDPTADGGYAAYAPDVPGCFTVGDTVAQTLTFIQEALAFHLEGLREDGDPIPLPVTKSAVLDADESIAWVEINVA